MIALYLALKNYLYAKNKVRFILPVLAVFMFTSCVTSVIKHKGDPKDDNEKSLPYDLPATAPIPPEKYCFEAAPSASSTKFELYTEGDSVYGKIVYAVTEHIPNGDFKGVIYGTTLLMNYKYKSDSGMVYQEQKWKLVDDSLFQIHLTPAADSSLTAQGAAPRFNFTGILHKVPCK